MADWKFERILQTVCGSCNRGFCQVYGVHCGSHHLMDGRLSREARHQEKNRWVYQGSESPGSITLDVLSGRKKPLSTSTYGLPPLSAFFVERPELTKTMANSLFGMSNASQRRMVFSGLGGIGKTQIAVSFLLQFLTRFRHVIFIDGSSVQNIESGILARVKSLGTIYSRTTVDDALDVLAHPDHEITKEWVIVYDNVDDPTIDIARYFPKCTFGSIIITTRNPNLGSLAPKAHIPVDLMTENESVEVILQSAIKGGSLEAVIERIRKINARVSEPVVAKIGEGVFSGLHYLHSKRVTHRGIKPSNILLSRNGMVKLCNFDISGNLQESFASSWTGMDMFLAPERVTGGQYSITADVWSAALSLLTLAQNRSPFPEHLDGMMELAIWIVKGDIPQLMDETVEQNGLEEVKWSDEMKDFISLCLTRDGMRRPKPSEALNHPWLALIALQSVNMAKWMREIRG